MKQTYLCRGGDLNGRSISQNESAFSRFSDVCTDVRILREIACASKTYQVDIIVLARKGLERIMLPFGAAEQTLSLSKYRCGTGKSAHKFYEQYYWRREENIGRPLKFWLRKK